MSNMIVHGRLDALALPLAPPGQGSRRPTRLRAGPLLAPLRSAHTDVAAARTGRGRPLLRTPLPAPRPTGRASLSRLDAGRGA